MLYRLLKSHHDGLFSAQVVDTDPSGATAGLSDVSQVEKYEISEEAYASRPGTVRSHEACCVIIREDNFRNFKKKFLKGVIEEEKKTAAAKEEKEVEERRLAEGIQVTGYLLRFACVNSWQVGNRCEVDSGKPNAKRGEVQFVGRRNSLSQCWVNGRLQER